MLEYFNIVGVGHDENYVSKRKYQRYPGNSRQKKLCKFQIARDNREIFISKTTHKY